MGTVETAPSVYVDNVIERVYTGDVVRDNRRLTEVDKVNMDISVGNSISIVADAYAVEHIFAMRYVKWSGVLWVVTEVTNERPRLLLRLGGVYNGPKPPASGPSL